MKLKSVFLILFVFGFTPIFAQPRQDILLNNDWHTQLDGLHAKNQSQFKTADFNDKNWKKVNIPHNWDDYGGYRRLMHGNLHGNAWYRKKFTVKASADKKLFLFFEGVGSYATVWLNGKKIGEHGGGRTTFTLDASEAIFRDGKQNTLTVYAEHPADIRDLPWVCGGCSDERGFSEGSQPLGIFRPVHLIISNPVKIEPFGVHAWNDTTVRAENSTIYLQTEVKNYKKKQAKIRVENQIIDKAGKVLQSTASKITLKADETQQIPQSFENLKNVTLWSLENPYLYKIVTNIKSGNKILDSDTLNYGIRWISWPKLPNPTDKRFYLNGKPVFINGIAEYEHAIGYSHAFTHEEIKSRISLLQQAGFNAFRDAHQPHNLLYGDLMEEKGILWWTQFSAHIWFDNPEFKANFKKLLKDWVKERRSNPAVVMWGLQNESRIPKEFAEECTQIIRDLDPTASSQRLVTTCNGGEGTDWDVPQNWTGTYGGDPKTYAEDLKKQILVGEYGAWRTLDLHTEGDFDQNGIYSEDRMAQLMEQKVRLADSVKNEISGHYFWLYNSHDNPGRVQGGEGFREIDAIGPVNYKGLFTSWGEPTDVYYMFKSNYAPKTEPMVYIVSHTWPNRWLKPGIKSGITVYSNCDEVELFNDVDASSLGKRKRGKTGTHFTWDNANIQYNILYAVGYIDGKAMVKDTIVLNHLPQSPNFSKLVNDEDLLKAQPNYNYLYRVNCGGGEYVDSQNQVWSADINRKNKETWGSTSWTARYENMPPYFASQRRTFDPIKNTADWPLFQHFRYGRDELKYEFPVANGEYLVELYFAEPWIGGGDLNSHSGERLMNIAVNDSIYLKNLDVWAEAGHNGALKKSIKVKVENGLLKIHFPQSAVGQSLISAIAIASANRNLKPAPASKSLLQSSSEYRTKEWLDIGDQVYTNKQVAFSQLPPKLFGATFLSSNKNSSVDKFTLNEGGDVYIAVSETEKTANLKAFENTKTTLQTDENGGKTYQVYRKRYKAGEIDLQNIGSKDYLLIAKPISELEPAYDLKPSKDYKPELAKFDENIELEKIYKYESLTFKAENKGFISWSFNTGVADVYSLTLRYVNQTDEDIKIKMELFSLDGSLMKTEVATLSPSIDGKWSYFTTTTGSMINAGTYTLRISNPEAKGLSISKLTVQ
ncbi:MAG TPA: malectin domain-containing carbohydrate-binding protein [Pelobium sp.]|nr:malectin domain-containing carbohydrate-binding protein [Pelobium sp.]